VRELYLKHNLERLEKKEQAQYVSLLINTGRRRIARHHFLIASILNEHFFVRVVHASLYSAEEMCEHKTIELLGSRENVLMAEYVYHFLLNQIHSHWEKFSEKKKGRQAKNSYYLGVLIGFRDKLEKEDSSGKEKKGVALVVAEDKELEN